MSKNATQIKTAIQSLNIKKPYDLRAQMRPKFQPPKNVQNEHTQKEQAQIEQGQNQAAHHEFAQEEPAQTKVAQDKHTQIREPRNGFFMLAHSVFENELTRKLSGDAFKVFIWMSSQAWRFQHSKGEFRGAVEYIALVSGSSRSTVTRSLRDLKELGLIECVERNYSKGNLWRVSSIANGRGQDHKNQDGQNEQTQNEHAQDDKTGCSKRASGVLKLNMEHAQNEHHLISSNKINNNSEKAAGDVAEALEDRKIRWEKFCAAFPSEADQDFEIRKQLEGQPFLASQPFARDFAVMKWWDGNYTNQVK